MTAPTPVFVSLKDLAARWKVSVGTARNRTCTVGFPVALDIGPRSLRWPLTEVEQWEQGARTERVRRIVTAARPQHRTPQVHPAARVRTIVKAA